MKMIERLLLENKAWAQGKTEIDPQFFEKMANDQKPEYLWIGCSDSRVHPAEITNSDPGEMFVHRNIANLVVHTDLNLLSVIQYAVEVLKVRHIIICGHYNCGGVKAALSPKSLGLINNWIRNIKETYSIHRKELELIPLEVDRTNRLVELNTITQVRNLASTSLVQAAWNNGQTVHIHGWVYDLQNGLIKTLIEVHNNASLDPAFRYEFN